MIRWCVAALAASCCAAEAVTASAIDGIDIELVGTVADPAPAAHASPISWLPVTWVAPEGSSVAAGDPLVRLAGATLERWMRDQSGDIAEAEASRVRDLAKAADREADLRARIAGMRADRAVLAARLARVDADLERTRRVLRIVAQRSRASADAAAARRLAVERIHAGGGASAADVAAAQRSDAQAAAQAGLDAAELDLAERSGTALTRARLERELRRLDAELGGDGADGGLPARLAVVEAERRRTQEVGSAHLAGLRNEERRRTAMLADPVIRATAAGSVSARGGRLELGAKVSRVPCMFVLGQDRMGAEFTLPDALRPLVAEALRGGPLPLRLVGAGTGAGMPGRIERLAVVARTAQGGGSGFVAEVRVDDPAPLRQGMTLRGLARLPLPPGAAAVPLTALVRREPAEIADAAGRRRQITGFAQGGIFVALAGIAPGEQVVPAGADAGGPWTATARIEPAAWTELRIAGAAWEWEVSWAAPEGTQVAAGDLVARLVRTGGWFDEQAARAKLAHEDAQAAADREVARLDAAAQRAEAAVALTQAEVAADLARIAEINGNLPADPLAAERSALALARARAAVSDAEREVADLGNPRIAETVPGARIRAAAVAREQADLRLRRAELDAAAARWAADPLAAMRLAAERAAAADQLAVARIAWSVALVQAQRAESSAADAWKRARQQSGWDRDILAGTELRAPVAGVLLHRHQDGRTWRVTDSVGVPAPFVIPTGQSRRVRFQVPVERAAAVRPGAAISLRIPAAGAQPVNAIVRSVGSSLLPGPQRSAWDEIRLDDRTVQVVVDLAEDAQLAAIPWGSEAHASF